MLFLSLVWVTWTNNSLNAEPQKQKTAIAKVTENQLEESVIESRTLYTLQKIFDKSTEDHFMISLKLDQPAPWTSLNLENHGSFLQLRLPDSMTMNPGQFQDIQGPYISKIATFQPDPATIIVRFFLRPHQSNADEIAKATSVEVLGEHIIVSTEMTPEPKKIAAIPIPKLDTIPPIQTPAQKIIHSEPKSKKANIVEALSRKVAIGIFLVMLLFTLFTAGHKFFRKKSNSGSNLPAQMQILNSINLSSKQKLTLVQVQDQKILISVSNDGIQVIPEFKDAVQNFGNVMHQPPKRQAIRNPEAPRRETLQPSHEEKKFKQSPSLDEIPESLSDNSLPKTSSPEHSQESVDDITKLIREKLRQYPGTRA
ncbi:MAG: flagellar biosynthetic protein FliO [Oligoflexales bacterium]